MIYTRKDGTFVIEVNGMPYHVIDTDPKYWQEVQDRLTGGEATEQEVPSIPEGLTAETAEWDIVNEVWVLKLDALKIKYFSQITNERNKRLANGFLHNTYMIQCDPISQSNAHAFLTKAEAGVLPYPIKWRTKDNLYMYLTTLQEVQSFTDDILVFVQTTYEESWIAKDLITASNGINIGTYVNNYMSGI